MCIIIEKPKYAKTPSRKVLKNCWDNNPDGAGYMYNAGGKVYIYKMKNVQ